MRENCTQRGEIKKRKGINQNEEREEEEATEEVWLSRIRNVLDTKPIEKAYTDSGIELAHRITGKPHMEQCQTNTQANAAR